MHRSLIVAKITPGAEDEVARIWTQSDKTDLPLIAGVRRRELYSLGDLYIHVLESDQPSTQTLRAARSNAEFDRISRQLEPFISPYLPTWRSPKDALATCFYSWTAADGRKAAS
jgi:cyclase